MKRPISYKSFKKIKGKRDRSKRFAWGAGDVEIDNTLRKPRTGDRFVWKAGDVEVHPPRALKEDTQNLHHGTYEHPHPEPPEYEDHHSRHNKSYKADQEQFEGHGHDIESSHPKSHHSILHYKEDGYETINKGLRGNHALHIHDHEHTKHLDHATSFKTKHDMHVYRGMSHDAHEFHKMKPGSEFTDHGYGSTTGNFGTAHSFAHNGGANFWDKSKPRHIMKIHVPKGTKAHHFDYHSNDNSHENEVVLHRGTRYRVSHHSHDHENNIHFIHAHVVGQHPREVKHDPNKTHYSGDDPIHGRIDKQGVHEAWFPTSTEDNPHGTERVGHAKGHYHDPHKEPDQWAHDHSKWNDSHEGHEQFVDHAKDIEAHHPKTRQAISNYKLHTYAHMNDSLRRDKPMLPDHHHDVEHMDHATSFKTKHDMHVYRGVNHMKKHELHALKPGTRFHDHGYTSTSSDHDTATNFGNGGHGDKKHVFKIHVPAGTKAHHVDAHYSAFKHEHEVVLHRGTHFEVTHHSSDKHHHYIHAKVVGQHPKPLSQVKKMNSEQEHHHFED